MIIRLTIAFRPLRCSHTVSQARPFQVDLADHIADSGLLAQDTEDDIHLVAEVGIVATQPCDVASDIDYTMHNLDIYIRRVNIASANFSTHHSSHFGIFYRHCNRLPW